MTSVDTNVDLIINQLTEEQYFQLSVQGKIDDNQLYLVPDNREYYEKSQTSSNVELTRKFDELSLDITNKVYFDDISSSGYNNLSIIKIPNEEYRKLVADGKCLSNVLYIISSEFEDFYGRVLSNVTMTEDDVESEVATKHYVDEVISEVDLSIAQNATNIDNNARNITTLTTKYTDSQLSIANISSRLSQCVKSDYLEANYYNKTQTSSSTEITDRFDKHIKVGTY